MTNLPLETRFIRTQPSAITESNIERRAEHLLKVFDRIDHIRVTVESHHHNRSPQYEVHVEIHAPRKRASVTRIEPDLQVALRDAFDAMEHTVERYADAHKRHGPRPTPTL